MGKNYYASKINGLSYPELFFNYKSNTTCFNAEKIFDSPFAQISLADIHWVTVTNFNPFYTLSIEKKWMNTIYLFCTASISHFIINLFVKNDMKRLNSKSDSIEIVHFSVYPQYGSDDCGLFDLGYIIALSEKNIHQN